MRLRQRKNRKAAGEKRSKVLEQRRKDGKMWERVRKRPEINFWLTLNIT